MHSTSPQHFCSEDCQLSEVLCLYYWTALCCYRVSLFLVFIYLFFNWSIVDLRYCVSFRCTAKWYIYTHIYMNYIKYISYIYTHVCMCIHIYTYTHMGFPGGTSSKEPTCQCRKPKRQVRSLGQEDPLEEGMATHSSILAWRIPWIKEPGGLQSIRLHRVLHDWRDLAHMHAHTRTHTHTHTHSCIHMLFQNLFHCRLLQGIEYSPVLYSKSMLLPNSWGWVPEAQKLLCPSVWLDVSDQSTWFIPFSRC